MVSGDVVGGSDGGQARRHGLRIARRGSAVMVLQVSQVYDIVRRFLCDGSKEVPVVFAEFGAVQVAEDCDAAAVKALRQVCEGQVRPGDLQSGVAPADAEQRRQNQKQQDQNGPQGAAPVRVVCHGVSFLLISMPTNYIIVVSLWREEK